MNIQPVGASSVPRVDERSAQPAAQAGAATASTATTGTSATTSATGATPSRDDVSSAVQKMNEALGSSQSLEFSIDEDSKDLVVKVVDQSTKEVVRQIPSKEALQIAKSIEQMQQRQEQQQQPGLLIDQTA
jgi:flagellar protein FlaG